MTSVASTAAIAQMLDIPVRRAKPLTPMELVTSIETGLKPQVGRNPEIAELFGHQILE